MYDIEFESWLMPLMVLWLILMSVSNGLSFHYNSITAPFTGLCSFYSGPRGGKGSWGQPMCIIYIFLKEQYNQKQCPCLMVFFMGNWVIVLLIESWRVRWQTPSTSDLWLSLQTCHIQVHWPSFSLVFFPPFSHSFIPHCTPHFFPSAPSLTISRPPDPLHAYLGLCGLSLIGEPSLRKVHPALNITQRAFQRLQQLQQTWRDSTDSCSRQHWQQGDPRLCLWTGSVIRSV